MFEMRVKENKIGVKEVRRMEEMKINVLSDQYTKLVVETDTDEPVTIAEITETDVIPADGYRVRLTPKYD